jgi:two-component system CheB/CheR fusion protein
VKGPRATAASFRHVHCWLRVSHFPERALESYRVLIVDDNEDDRLLVKRELLRSLPACEVDEAGDPTSFSKALGSAEWGAVITDFQLGWSDGLAVLKLLRQSGSTIPVILFTDSGNEEVAVQAMKEGADDYVVKSPGNYSRLPFVVQAAVEREHRRKEAMSSRAAARLAETRLDLAFQLARIGSWQLSISTGKFQYSPQMGPMFGREVGFTHESVEDWLASVHPEDRSRVLKQREDTISGETPSYRCEYRAIGPDGSVRWLLSVGQVYGNGSPSLLGVTVDVTDRRTLEDELRTANRMKDEFLAMLAHELRNPLAPLANAHTLLRMSGTLALTEQKYLEIAERQTAQLTRLVDDLMEVARVTSGRIHLRKEPVLVATVVYNAVESVRPLMESRRQRVSVEMSADPGRAVIDSARMAQVLANLLSNASKYSPPDTTVTVKVSVEPEFVQICVEDQGEGIAPDLLPALFTLFRQAERTLDRSQGGLGVGLALAKRLVELHGGSIRAESEGVGRGARFCLTLPRRLDHGDEQRSRAPVSATVTAPSRRILVIDDNRDAAETLATLLRLKGHDVVVAYDGVEGLEQAQKTLPDLAIIDIGLPRLNGYEIAKILRDDPRCRTIGLVALSGYGQEADREASRAAGFHRHLAKPISFDTLEQVLADLYQSSAE